MLKKFIQLAFFFPVFLFAQNDFSEIDQLAKEVPSSASSSIDELANYLTQNAETELEKVRALYVWVTENIRYDTKLFFDEKATESKKAAKQEPEIVLKTKRGVCEGYSNLFHELAIRADLAAEKVSGFTKNQRGRIARTTHAWNAVRVDGQWYLLDNTWGAGYIDNNTQRFKRRFEEKYFLAKPEVFVLDHYPHDPLFQMLKKPVTWEKWQEDDKNVSSFISTEASAEFVGFQDSLNLFNSLPESEKVFNSAFRTLRFDPQNGYANFITANYYFDEARKDFEIYRSETAPFTQNPKKLNNKQINAWSKIIARSKEKLEKAKEYLEIIEPGNKFYRHSRSAKKNVNTAMSNIRNAKSQIKAFREYVKRKGS